MKIGGFQKFSLIDYPGKIAAVIFTQGCNFRCPYCHNPELVLPELFEEGPSVDEILKFLEFRKGKLEAVVITGGEPTLQNDLSGIIKRINELGYSVKLDTNGTNPDVLKSLIDQKLIDYIAMDIKAPFEKYDELAGIKSDLKKIKESIRLIMISGIDYEFRTTVVKYLLTEKDVEILKAEFSNAKRYVLKDFNPAAKILSEVLK
ncbi:MAG: anaerobic ribonucleoside-triphosphate reductase activating protein [Elusimicrobia bacterium]|nr:anaerobic ribonucleoside-triphosphate reductase activating protein [Elusimicrobiota bacterium]